MTNPRLRSSRWHTGVAAVALSCLLLRPANAVAQVVFAWVPSDGSASSGTMTIDTAASGPFSVSATRVMALEFTFRPGVSVGLGRGYAFDGGAGPVMSFDGSGLDNGNVGVRNDPGPVQGDFDFSPDQLGADVALYWPDVGLPATIRVTGQWVRTDIVPPPKPPYRIGVLKSIDIQSILLRHNVGNTPGLAYNAASDVLYLAHGSDPSGGFIYTLDLRGNLIREINLQQVYRPGSYPNSLSYDDVTGHLFVEVIVELPSGPHWTIVEMSPDGSSIFREISVPGPVGGGQSMVRADGIWQTQFALDTIRHYTADGKFVEEISVEASFPPGFPGPEALTSAIDDPTGGFLLVDHFGQRIVQVDGVGREIAATTTGTLDKTLGGGGRGQAIATDSGTPRIFLVGSRGHIFVLSPDYLRTRVVNDFLRLVAQPIVRWDPTTFRLTATFENTSDLNLCGLFFLMDGSLEGRAFNKQGRPINQANNVALEPTGEWLQGYDQMTTGHRQADLRAHESITLTFTLDRRWTTWFDFVVDAWAVPRAAASTCGQPD